MALSEEIKKAVRDIPDFPKKGVLFKDITPLLKNPNLLTKVIGSMAEAFQNKGIQKVLGVESRGFLLAAAVAHQLQAGLIPVRKKGKLPYRTLSATYQLEYGTDTLEVHADALERGEKVLIVDDVLATGGTASATCDLVRQLQGEIVGLAFLIELSFLKGREKLKNRNIFSLVQY